MREITEFCQGWIFRNGFDEAWTRTAIDGRTVTLPHSAVELPADYFDETVYQRPFTYQRRLDWDDRFEGREVWLVFEGAMADAHVYADGALLGRHPDGYTPFEVLLTEALGRDGVLLTVCVDGTENPDIPPFGGQIDYLTYAGIYREVWLRVTDPVSIANVKIETPDVLADAKVAAVTCHTANPGGAALHGTWTAELLDAAGAVLAVQSAPVDGATTRLVLDGLTGISLWLLTDPVLYRLRLTLVAGESRDRISRSFGFRHAEFAADGFRLNGEKIKLMGLNRHQSFPYVGYAMGRAAQERDAEILKHDLACNIVRTSHYPQSPWFLEHCDRIGLLVLEEIPGWQHLGGPAWKDEAVKNVRRMIERDWNHPSIVLWGVRINESDDDDALYARTNALARELDPTRQTGGIRKHTDSTLLEDVYTFNDFIQGDFEQPFSNRPRTALRSQQEVTGLDRKVPYLITEYNGHMYPTKVFDQEQRQMEHVTRHLDILNAMHGDDDIAGCIGWCLFDYNTHKDFGSGDRVCHHGVLTQFREPKFASFAYASQGDPRVRPVLQPVTYWSRGERNIGGTLPLMILTNCDMVRLRFPGGEALDVLPDRATYPHLPHPPAILRHADVPGDALGKWGMRWTDVEFIGFLDGQEVVRRDMVADPVATQLQVAPDADTLEANHQEVRVAIRALDRAGNSLPFIDAGVRITVSGPGRLIGPASPTLRGGATACWVRSTGEEGDIGITVDSARFQTVTATVHARLGAA